MKKYIRTSKGDISAEKIKGYILAHEHLNIDSSKIKKDPDAALIDPKAVLEELIFLQENGVDVFVDVTPNNLGRDPVMVEQFNNVLDRLYIISPTSYLFGPYLPEKTINSTPEEIAEIFIKDITVGIDGSGIKAGVIGEVGTSHPMLPAEKRLLAGATLAQKETDMGIITHTQFGFNPLEQQKFLEKAGANLNRVGFGHMDLYPDYDFFTEIAKNGSYVCIDNVGREDYRPDYERVEMVKFMFEKGFGNKVIVSSDISRRSHLIKNGGKGYRYVITKFRQALRESGFSEENLKQLFNKNPLKLLSFGK